MINVTKDLADTSAMLIDLLQGDMSIYGDRLKNVDLAKVQSALDLILGNPNLSDGAKNDLLNNNWRVLYRVKPPTPEEFLTTKWLGDMANDIYPHVRQWFLEFMNPLARYRNAIFYSFIGSGKSTLSGLINVYITIHLSLMRNPNKYFGLAVSANLSQVLCSFNLTKAQELLLEPIENVLNASPIFERVRTKEDMVKKLREFDRAEGIDKVYWTTASRNGASALQFPNKLQYKLASSPHTILGLNIVAGTLSELAFFEQAGKGPDYIMKFYNDMKGRIESRLKVKSPMKINYWGRTILDSSPNNIESPVDKFAYFEAHRDPMNYVIKGSRWKWIPQDFKNVNDTFPIFKGGSGKPPMIVTSEAGYDPEDILHAPVEIKHLFEDDLVAALKNVGGVPQGALDKLFYNYDKIEECFVDKMKNIYSAIKADAKMPPQGLIWNQVKDHLFEKVGDRYRFYYKPNIPRVFHIDQSISGDTTGIAFVHVERKFQPDPMAKVDLQRDLVYVVDFVVPISPMGGRINLDAVREFALDCRDKGGLPIIKGSYDTFQSEASIQFLDRCGIEMEHISVDETLDPYLFMAQLIEQGNLKLGRSIYFKNNLRSLRITKRQRSETLKIDHTMGDSVNPIGADEKWETSSLGLHAKDISDAIAGAVYNAKMYLAGDGRSLVQTFEEDKVILSSEQIKLKTDDFLKMMGMSRSIL